MEDREFEELKFKFDQHKQLDDKLLQTSRIFDKQLFAFNIGLITLIFLLLNKLYDTQVHKCLCIIFILIAFLSIISSILLMGTYIRTRKIIAIQQGLIFDFDQDSSDNCDVLDARNARHSAASYWICVVSWIAVVLIFLAIFVIDFKKELSNNPSINDNPMSTRNISNNLSGFDGKSFGQLTHKADSMQLKGEGTSFAQNSQKIVEMQVKNVTQKPQKPQPESTIKQPSNTQ